MHRSLRIPAVHALLGGAATARTIAGQAAYWCLGPGRRPLSGRVRHGATPSGAESLGNRRIAGLDSSVQVVRPSGGGSPSVGGWRRRVRHGSQVLSRTGERADPNAWFGARHARQVPEDSRFGWTAKTSWFHQSKTPGSLPDGAGALRSSRFPVACLWRAPAIRLVRYKMCDRAYTAPVPIAPDYRPPLLTTTEGAGERHQRWGRRKSCPASHRMFDVGAWARKPRPRYVAHPCFRVRFSDHAKAW